MQMKNAWMSIAHFCFILLNVKVFIEIAMSQLVTPIKLISKL